MISETLALVHFTVGTVGPKIHPMVIAPDPECIIEIDILSSWKNLHTGFLTCGVRTIMVRKNKWKPLKLFQKNKKSKAISQP